MRPISLRTTAILISLLVFAISAFGWETDDTIPEVTERVVRISYVSGDVQIRRIGSDEWEKAELNLPVVEGDDLVTAEGARLEIQFNRNTYLRMDERSTLQIKGLGDEGIALSVSSGTVMVNLRKFDKDKEYLEFDAPGTTVAVQREGNYRIDAGAADSKEVRVSVTDGGEARVYSTTSGFTLRSGRSAKVELDGEYAGEWETEDAALYADLFGEWASDRDKMNDKRLSNSYVGKYYDQDIYGADELNDNGSWLYTSDYGYVWQPYSSAIATYSSWTPYRYGTWRWVSPFGWTWVNDEPWGWATYHHGRWVWYRNHWVWTPYAYYRSNRSWWYPALVVVSVIDRNICWYPLSYRQHFYDYNYGYHDWVGNRDRRRRHDEDGRRGGWNGNAGNTTPAPVTPRFPKPMGKVAPIPDVPDTGVVMLPKDDFGTGRKRPVRPSAEIAKGILEKRIGERPEPSELPNYETVKPKLGREIAVAPEARIIKSVLPRNTGAAERTIEKPLDQQLKDSRFYGDRQPARRPSIPKPVIDLTPRQAEREVPRDTGVVTRQLPKRPPVDGPPNVRVERTQPSKELPTAETRGQRPETPQTEQPSYRPGPRKELPRVEPTERRETPAPRQEQPKYQPPPEKEQPRGELPPRRGLPTPRPEQPRSEPAPRREPPPQQPKSSPPEKGTPPVKSTPSDKPAPTRQEGGARKKDN